MNELNWQPADNLKLEKNAEKVVKSIKNSYVIAGPGAGKTELLAQRADYLLRTNICKRPRKILAISFKRDAAKNILDRVKRRCGNEYANRFVSLTHDAFTKLILDHFIFALTEEYRPSLTYNIAGKNDMIKAFEIVGYNYNNRAQKESSLRSIVEFPLPYSSIDLSKYAWSEYIPEVWNILLKGKDNFEPKISFQMVARLSDYLIRENPKIHKCLMSTFSHIFLDEFQDTTSLQYEFMKTCFLNTDSVLTAVGDNRQRIMIWAGADREIFKKFETDFKAEKTPLYMNFRSAPRLIEIQKIFSQHLSGTPCEVNYAEKWGVNDGICEIWNFANPENESLIIADQIDYWIKTEDIGPKDICVIVKQRSDKYGREIIKALSKRKIIARDESQLQDLLAEDCVQIVLDIITLTYSSTAREEWFRTIELIKFLRCINFDQDDSGVKFRRLEKEINRYLLDLKKDFSNIGNKSDLEIKLWEILKFLGLNEIKILFPQYRRGAYLNHLMQSLLNKLWEEYRLYNNWIESVEALKGNRTISIMTIHKSKGLEYDTIIFLGLEDQAFWSFKNQTEEDTCAFFVALSRAKRRLIFTFSNIRDTGYNDQIQRQTKSDIISLYELLEKSKVVVEKRFA